ncbi:hypothetical protein ABC347_11020 [Sphingomonas sp. 1P06PA]|uniref:hypothetical protein n=1 Tax=Sphingomonas sp. 1P06PA TaxID=554121 RepID=UPI0039A49681
MTRYRATTFGRPLGPWRGSSLLAFQDAVEADEATRDPISGIVFLTAPAKIEEDDYSEPIAERDADRLAALEMINRYFGLALYAIEKAGKEARERLDPDEVERLRRVWREAADIMRAARDHYEHTAALGDESI